MQNQLEEELSEPETPEDVKHLRIRLGWLWVCVAFLAGVTSAYLAWGRPRADVKVTQVISPTSASVITTSEAETTELYAQINPPKGYTLPARYNQIGPALLSTGAIDLDSFIQLYQDRGKPLTAEQVAILTQGSDQLITIDSQNAHFLLNLFWAFGLANANPILTKGPITEYSQGQIGRFASTGGWTLGLKPADELFASVEIVRLTAEQQARVEDVAAGVYRPCCNNPTLFPDCNHGMAMLGLLELMASQDASVDDMYAAAKYVNAFWFPQQALEAAIYLKASQNVSFAEAEPRQVLGQEMFSASGFQMVHQSLQTNGLLQQAPGTGNGCGS